MREITLIVLLSCGANVLSLRFGTFSGLKSPVRDWDPSARPSSRTTLNGLTSRKLTSFPKLPLDASRRVFLAASTTLPLTVWAQTESTSLESRLGGGTAVFPAPYGIEAPDVYYPPWFDGEWTCSSTTVSVEAPAGVGLFGGNRTFTAAREDVGQTLVYKTRFRPSLTFSTEPSRNSVVSDREFNVASIARAIMGENAVREVSSGRRSSRGGGMGGGRGSGDVAGLPVDNEASAACVAVLLAPAGAGGALFRAELTTTQRHVEVNRTHEAPNYTPLATNPRR